MRQSASAVLGLLLLGPSLITAAPHAESAPSPYTYSHDSSAYYHNRTPRPWRRLSDAIIRRIWGLPEKQKGFGGDSGDTDVSRELPAPKLLAAYGDDMVLRFNISTTEEASALAEAADILFLDVWEFNEDWVDIRISKDVVSLDTIASC
jgi:extracellular matrix protein 14